MSTSTKPRKVVICGAGPAGLLAAIFLLRRNQDATKQKYQVVLVDPGVDYGKLDDEGLKRFRSWMIGLSCHGLAAVKQVPGLYEDYIESLGINITKAMFCIGPSIKFSYDINDSNNKAEGFTVDRNYICAALARYLNEKFTGPEFTSHYKTSGLFVDVEKQCVMVRSSEGKGDMKAIPYDLLLGCDGIRSIVRNAFVTNHREFEFDLKGTFGTGKSVHITRPADVAEGQFMFMAECLPNSMAFVLPETGGKLNFACGYANNKPCDPDLLSDDPVVVSKYFQKHFKGFDMDFEEMGKEWATQSLASTQMVHCNFYHSIKLKALLLGDAAHATSPNIGQGMNTALEDAAVLNELLDNYEDDLEAVLPAFSEERVKEGNALTDLSFHTFSLSGSTQMAILIRQNVRRYLNGWFRWLVSAEPMNEFGQGMKLSVAYHKMAKLGYMKKVRRINNEIMQEHFEKTTGMVQDEPVSFWDYSAKALFFVAFAGAGAYYYSKEIYM